MCRAAVGSILNALQEGEKYSDPTWSPEIDQTSVLYLNGHTGCDGLWAGAGAPGGTMRRAARELAYDLVYGVAAEVALGLGVKMVLPVCPLFQRDLHPRRRQ